MHCLVVNVCTACGVAPTTSEACSCKGPLQNAFRGQGCFHILSSSLLSFQSCSTSCAPALLNDPPAEMKALCNISQRTVWHFIWHVYSKKYIVKQNFIVGSSGDDSAESNMQSGKDDEDLQKALALSLEPLEDRTGAELGSLLTWCKKVFRHGSAQFTILRSCWPQATCI